MPATQHEIRIVPASLEYVESFRECLDSVARERRWLMTLQAPPLEEVRNYWEAKLAEEESAFFAFFALDRERVVGFIDIKRNTEESIRHRGQLGMGVHRDYRGQGIGKRLLQTALDKAKQCGLMRVDLTVYISNTAALALYRKLGFVEEGRTVKGRYLDGRFDDVIQMGLIFPENLPADGVSTRDKTPDT